MNNPSRLALLLLGIILLALTINAFQTNSSNYHQSGIISEGGSTNTGSSSYTQGIAVGEIIGETSSTTYGTQLGFFYGVAGFIPSIVLNKPLNGSFHAVSYVLLNKTVTDLDDQPVDIYVWVANSTAQLDAGSNSLLHVLKNVHNTNPGITLDYNWTAQVIQPDNNDAGTVLLMHFDNMSGFGETTEGVSNKTNDFSKYSRDGIIYGATFNSTGGKFAGAFEFDGMDDYLDLGNGDILNILDEITIEAWIKPGQQNFTQARYVVSDYQDDFTMRILSYVDNNNITYGSKNMVLDSGQMGTIAAADISPGTVINGTGPFEAHHDSDYDDMPVPESFAGKEFVYSTTRNEGGQDLYFCAPFEDADLSFYNYTRDLVGSLSLNKGDCDVFTFTFPDNRYYVNSTGRVLGQQDQGEDGFVLYPMTNDLWGISSTAFYMIGADGVNVTTYHSNETNKDYSGNFGDIQSIGGSGSQGTGNAIHLIANKTAIGAIQLDDFDGSESTSFYPYSELSHTFGLPDTAQYIAIATTEPDTSCYPINANGTRVDVLVDGVSFYGDHATSRSRPYPYPNKIYFGQFSTTETVSMAAGTIFVCDALVYAYFEEYPDDETNMWGLKDPGIVFKPGSYGLAYSPSGKVDGYINAKGLSADASMDEWHHVVLTYNGSEIRLYLDGELQDYDNLTGSILVSKSNLTIGKYGNEYYKGNIDEVAIWNKSLSADEILNHYKLKSSKYYWKVNVTDSSKQTSESETWEFTLDATKPKITSSINNSVPKRFEVINISANVTDEYALRSCQFIHNQSGPSSLVYENRLVSETGDKCSQNFTIILPRDNVINFTVIVYDTSNNTNQSEHIITIANTPPPKVTLRFPQSNNYTINRTLTFGWYTVTDADNDSLLFNIYIECIACSIDNRDVNTTNLNYTPSELLFLGDDNYFYNWSVRAIDNSSSGVTSFGDFSDEWNITINSYVSLSLLTDEVDFGSDLNLAGDDNTTDGSPGPIIVDNDGNVNETVSIYAEDDLWESASNPTDKFRFKIDNTTEKNAFNWAGSITNWTNLPNSIETAVVTITSFDYHDTNDSAEVDLYVKVPTDEPFGEKQSKIVFEATKS